MFNLLQLSREYSIIYKKENILKYQLLLSKEAILYLINLIIYYVS